MVLLGILGAASVSRVTGVEAIRSVLVHQSSAVPPSTAAAPLPRSRRHLERSRAHRTGWAAANTASAANAATTGNAGNADTLVVLRAGLYLHGLLHDNRGLRQQHRPQQHRYQLGKATRNGAGMLCVADAAGVGTTWPFKWVRRSVDLIPTSV